MFSSRFLYITLAIFFFATVGPLSTTGNLFAQKAVQLTKSPAEDEIITTAEQLIAQIEAGVDPLTAYSRKHQAFHLSSKNRLVKLSPDEKSKAIKLLREKFQFKSIQMRLAFQGEYAPEKKAQKPTKPSGMFFSGTPRTEALKLLHSQEVESFIEREGQGVSRMRIITPYDLKPMKFADRLYSSPVESKVKGEPVIPLRRERSVGIPIRKFQYDQNHWVYSPEGLPSQELVELYHMDTADNFTTRTGLVRSIDQVAGFEPHKVRIKDQKKPPQLMNWASWPHLNAELAKKLEPQSGIEWRTNRIELIGMLMHDEPRAYVSDRLPNMEELASGNAKTRGLSDFESESLEQLTSQPDEEAVIRSTMNRILMVGAIRASSSCLECHKGKEGDMMGAFSYEFLRHPEVKEGTW